MTLIPTSFERFTTFLMKLISINDYVNMFV